jgi:hypothetical protein
MTEFSAIPVLNFSGRKEEWPSWSEKFLAKAKRSWIKDVLLGKVEFPTSLEVIDEKTEEGKRLLCFTDLNEIAFTELILSIDVSNSNGKIALGIVKSCKTKEFEDGNVALAGGKLKKKYGCVSAPSLVKTERMFRESRLGKNEDPEIWINLFCIGKALKNGFNLGNDGEKIKLMKGNVVILFDRCLKSKSGFVPGIKMRPVLADVGTTVVDSKKERSKNTIDVNHLHKIWVTVVKSVRG